MLTRLEIRSFAVIDHAVFCPGEGLNVISGETGAGKSLLIDAIGLILGDKASKSLIRNDSEQAFVEAVFDCSSDVMERIGPIMDEYGIVREDGNVIVTRNIGKDGKSQARINGNAVVLSQLKRIMGELVDIHGQSDNSTIFDPAVHIDLLDSFGSSEITKLLGSYQDKLQAYKTLTLRYAEVNKLASSSDTQKEYLEFAVKQIEDAGLHAGEDEELLARKKEISALSKNSALIDETRDFILGTDNMGLTPAARLSEGLRRMKKISSFDPSFEKYATQLEGMVLDLEAFASDYDSKTSSSLYSEDEEKKVNDRLGRIFELEAKYGKTIDDVIAFGKDAKSKLSDIDSASLEAAALKKKIRDAEADLLKTAQDLSERRKALASKMSDYITCELADLEMPSASFFVEFKNRPKERFFNSKGIDDVTFMFSANPGQPPMNLAQTASGGEASRIMLAIKNILSKADKMPTLIFDEIDTGVSGRASLSIAKKLRSISKDHQVLCVSHTAQLAAASDNNFLIEKNTDGNNTYTEITALDDEGRIAEVSRLLSGKTDKESGELASKMILELRT
ncbi:MAG: DNA repair protein RecN [Clostridiales bacterium]|nr:DNA repair protein RecN [Clostridiales bacterium]